jgi:hypothetical protein
MMKSVEPLSVFTVSGVTLESVELAAAGWAPHESSASMRSWKNETGDLLSLHLFNTRPDIGARLGDLRALRTFFRTMVLKNGGGIVAVDVLELSGVPAVRAIVKVPQEPKGTTYLASLTIPRRDFSFVLKVQCQEVADIGAREAALYGRFAASPRFDPAQPLAGWEDDPYEDARHDKIMRNASEAEQYDAQFPGHPLSRARRCLHALEGELRLHEEVARAPAFYGPD